MSKSKKPSSILPFDTPPEENFRTIGNERTGTVKVPEYGSMTTREARDMAGLAKRQADKRGVNVDEANQQMEEGLLAEGEDSIDMGIDFAHILIRSRLNKDATREQVADLPVKLIMSFAAMLMDEAAAGNEGEEGAEGKASATSTSQESSLS